MPVSTVSMTASYTHSLSSSVMTTSTTAAVLHGPADLRITTRPLFPAPPNHATVAVKATGLCGSDLHYYLHARNGDFCMQSPMVLGHESAGIVLDIGSGNEKGLYPGQPVVIEPGAMCGSCTFCTSGKYNLCKNMRFRSSAKTFPHLDGTLQSRLSHPVSLLHPIPRGMPLDVAALAEPLAVVLHAAARGGLCDKAWFETTERRPYPSEPSGTQLNKPLSPRLSDCPESAHRASNAAKRVLVFGVGTIGILACAVAKSMGVRTVVAVDIDSSRLRLAKDGDWADEVWCLPNPNSNAACSSSGSSPLVNGVHAVKAPMLNGVIGAASSFQNPNPAAVMKQVVDESIRKSRNTIDALLKSRPLATSFSSSSHSHSDVSSFLSSALSNNSGFDIVFECTGVPPSIHSSIFLARPGGVVCLVGMGSPNLPLPLGEAASKEVDLRGCFRYAGTWGEAVRRLGESVKVFKDEIASSSSLSSSSSPFSRPYPSPSDPFANGALGPVHRLITHKFKLSEAKKAFELMKRGVDEERERENGKGEGKVLKVVVLDE